MYATLHQTCLYVSTYIVTPLCFFFPCENTHTYVHTNTHTHTHTHTSKRKQCHTQTPKPQHHTITRSHQSCSDTTSHTLLQPVTTCHNCINPYAHITSHQCSQDHIYTYFNLIFTVFACVLQDKQQLIVCTHF